MPSDKKISGLTALTSLVGVDLLVVVDDSATETKKITFTNLQATAWDFTGGISINSTAMTTTAAELNTLDGYTGNVNDFNIITGAAAAGITAIEFQYLNGVTSAIQTQLNTKAADADVLKKDGSVALAANWDAGNFNIRTLSLTADGLTPGRLIVAGVNGLLSDATVTESSGALGGITIISMSGQLTNTLTIGTAPLVITSTTKVVNLNVDLLDDQSGSYYLDSANFTGVNWTDLIDTGATTLHKHDHGGMDGLADDDHAQYILVAGTRTFTGAQTFINSGIHILDTNASHDLILAVGSDLSADKTFTLTTGDSDRTITLAGNPTLNDWFDQSVKTTVSPGFVALSLAGDLTDYEATNDASPEFRLGSTDAEELHIQTVYDAGLQTLNYVLFQTDVASAIADKGQFIFNVDGTEIVNIDDGGIEIVGTVTIGTAFVLTGGINTFNLTNGTASLDVASGAVVDVNAGLTVESASLINQDLTSDASPTFAGLILSGAINSDVVGNTGTFTNTTDNASVQVAIFEGDRATPVTSDAAYISLKLSDSAGNQDEFGRIAWVADDATSTSEDGRIEFYNIVAGILQSTPVLTLDGGNVGIGTTGPGQRLSVQGALLLGPTANNTINALIYADAGIVRFRNTVDTNYVDIDAATVNARTAMVVIGTSASTFAGPIQVTSASNSYFTGGGNVGIGTTGPDRLLHPEVSDAIINAVTYGLRISHITSGTAAASFGTGIEFELEGADTTNLVAGAIETIWTDASTGSEDADMIFKVSTGGAVASETMRIISSGYLGINTTGPDRRLDVLDATNPQLRLTYTDGSVYTDLQTDSTGRLIITPSGGDVTFYRVDNAPVLNFNRDDSTPLANDNLIQFIFYGDDSLGNSTQWGYTSFVATNVTNGTETGKYVWNALDSAADNEAMNLTAAGLLSVDADGGGTDDPVLLFDDYDDAVTIQKGIQKRNRKLLSNMGIYSRKDTGSGYMMKLQPMINLLGGGIYQTRELIDAIVSDLKNELGIPLKKATGILEKFAEKTKLITEH